ncbi:MAG TPA: hypothetical protein H9830_08980 [Candidatus Agrococcus pullicola]|uniref:Uncharacterized protein n=1 Tax=Candidatus Agrococcus pullicola TaxID=2838429 RepID=A0A9D2CA44_9MICO|nr:hypothetical protein [Candidatus Agrococcus pullicola]
MADNINQVLELINIGVAVAALFAGAWLVLLLAAIAVRALMRKLGLAEDDDRGAASVLTRRSRISASEPKRNTTVSEVAS